jgi:outer membrane lipoprotein SlyB
MSAEMFSSGPAFRRHLVVLLLAPLVGACTGPATRPVLYPNEHLRQVGQVKAQQDLAECEALARQAGASPNDQASRVAAQTVAGAGIGAASGAGGGAIGGAAGTGAAVGAAGAATAALLHGLFTSSSPNPAYIEFVNRCLSERGYEMTGWQ